MLFSSFVHFFSAECTSLVAVEEFMQIHAVRENADSHATQLLAEASFDLAPAHVFHDSPSYPPMSVSLSEALAAPPLPPFRPESAPPVLSSKFSEHSVTVPFFAVIFRQFPH